MCNTLANQRYNTSDANFAADSPPGGPNERTRFFQFGRPHSPQPAVSAISYLAGGSKCPNGPDGKPARILSVSRDTTALMESQEQQRLLNGELGHRLKNLLMLIQSIAMQTFRQAISLNSASADFAARLAALGKATDVLTATSWHKATLYEIVKAGITSIDGLVDRVSLTGPNIELSSQPALALTLALQELSTTPVIWFAVQRQRHSRDKLAVRNRL
jgi:hypothetical protein